MKGRESSPGPERRLPPILHPNGNPKTAAWALLLLKRGVEGELAGGEVDPLDKLAGLLRAVETVHAHVFPLDRQRALVADLVQRADDLLEVHPAVAQRTEVPAAAGGKA